jgi:hypothetical protein
MAIMGSHNCGGKGGWGIFPGFGFFLTTWRAERIPFSQFTPKYRYEGGLPSRVWGCKGGSCFSFPMPKRLQRHYGQKHLHFVTFCCYQRRRYLETVRARNLFVKVLGEVRTQFNFLLVGYVVMPDHVHLLLSEPPKGTVS